MISTTKKRKKERKKEKRKKCYNFWGASLVCRCVPMQRHYARRACRDNVRLRPLVPAVRCPVAQTALPIFLIFFFLAHGFERFSQLSLLQNNNKNKKKYTTHTHSSPLCSSPFSFLSSFFLSPAHSHFAVTTSKHATLQDTNQTLQVVLFRTS